jgi:NAD-dependent dihydropyrimidine dehydrogenase PreA subunit
MDSENVYGGPNVIIPNRPVLFDANACTGCNSCVETCMMDVLLPNPEQGKPPIVLYPDECWYCGCCVQECPSGDAGAIYLNWPLTLRMRWKRKETGENYRLGMPDPPPPNEKPPV